MTKQEPLKIFERDTTITLSQLRKAGYIPATVYGKSIEPFSIQVKAHEFEVAISRGVRNFKLDGLGKSMDVQVKQLQKRNTTGSIRHIEFLVPSAPDSKAKSKQKSQNKAASQQQPQVEENVATRPEEVVSVS